MDLLSVVLMANIIVIGLVVNLLGLVFLIKKDTRNTLKDKVVMMLCVINSLQCPGFGMEMKAAVQGSVTQLSCESATFLICSLTYTSIGYFVVLAFERYVAIIHPFQYSSWFSFKNSVICLSVAPVYGFSIAVIPLLGWSGYARPDNNSIYCTFDFRLKSTKSYFITAAVLYFVGPVLLTSISSIRIFLELRRSALEARRTYGTRSNITADSSKSVIEQSLSTLFTWFVYVGSWIPYSVVCFLYLTDQQVSQEFGYVAKFMSKSSTIFSTVAYCLVERQFRCFVSERICLMIFRRQQKARSKSNESQRKVSKPVFV